MEHQTPAILCRKAIRCFHFPRSAAKILHRKGLSWTRPTYTLAKGNLDEQKQFEKQMDLIKKT
ncbi:winged helix-turn-helix domain-containing protein [Caldalkalibacillus thermarum]|uniref:winged helix-turn-helix domain-containing protein n=1 Tax=Caldalkalibacillus thermarum TaxID=296745 RepID=UPI003FCE4D78